MRMEQILGFQYIWDVACGLDPLLNMELFFSRHIPSLTSFLPYTLHPLIPYSFQVQLHLHPSLPFVRSCPQSLSQWTHIAIWITIISEGGWVSEGARDEKHSRWKSSTLGTEACTVMLTRVGFLFLLFLERGFWKTGVPVRSVPSLSVDRSFIRPIGCCPLF